MPDFILDEASNLTPEEKMDDWAAGRRKENIKACGDAKLKLYYDICVRKGYVHEANAILAEASNRGLSWASQATTTTKTATSSDYANEIKNLGFSSLDFQFTDGQFVKSKAGNGKYIDLAVDALGDENKPTSERVKKFIVYIILALVLGYNDVATNLKNLLPHDKTVIKALTEVITNVIYDKVIMGHLLDIKKEVLAESLHEKMEKHDELNPLLFDKEKHLYPDVREKLLQIADEFIKDVKEDEVKFNLKDIKIVGSNCSYNYNPDSDLDMHIVAETKSLKCPDDLYPVIYDLYRSLWNKNFEPTIKGIPVELYVETEATQEATANEPKEEKELTEVISKGALVSNGIYSVLDDKWIKEPVATEIPEINQKEIDDALAPWLLRYNEITKAPTLEAIESFINDLYTARQASIAKEGEYNPTNYAFKALRAAGQLDEIRELKRSLREKELSLEEAAGNTRYCYYGPVHKFDTLLAKTWSGCTTAPTEEKAFNNLTVQAKRHFGYTEGAKITLDKRYMYEDTDYDDQKPHTCEKCGRLLNDSGECPLCDLGDESVLEEAVTDNLEEKVRELVKDFSGEDKSKLSIMEFDDIVDGFVEEFGEDEDGHRDVINFGKFTYNDLSDEDIEKGKPIITFLLSGGLNGPGDWGDYLKDVSSLFDKFHKELGLHAIVYKMDNDICDDVWTAEVLLYVDREETKESLKEDLIVIEPFEAKEKIEEIKKQIEESKDWRVRKNLLTLMNIYLFQTMYESDHAEETKCNINEKEWKEYSDWHTDQGKKLCDEHPELEKEEEDRDAKLEVINAEKESDESTEVAHEEIEITEQKSAPSENKIVTALNNLINASYEATYIEYDPLDDSEFKLSSVVTNYEFEPYDDSENGLDRLSDEDLKDSIITVYFKNKALISVFNGEDIWPFDDTLEANLKTAIEDHLEYHPEWEMDNEDYWDETAPEIQKEDDIATKLENLEESIRFDPEAFEDIVLDSKVRDWYAGNNPYEFQLEDIPADLTWKEVIDAIDEGKYNDLKTPSDTEPRDNIWAKGCQIYYAKYGKLPEKDLDAQSYLNELINDKKTSDSVVNDEYLVDHEPEAVGMAEDPIDEAFVINFPSID